MTKVVEYTPDDFLAGDEPLKTGRAFAAAGQTFVRLTPLMQNASGLLVKWDGSAGKAVAMAVKSAEALASDTLMPFYKTGCFRISAVQWPDGLTDAQKRAAFIGSPISVDDEM